MTDDIAERVRKIGGTTIRSIGRVAKLFHTLCDEASDVATASLLENWIDQSEQRSWFLFEAPGSCVNTQDQVVFSVFKRP
jgi:starvation-inducible DNA-binding protein